MTTTEPIGTKVNSEPTTVRALAPLDRIAIGATVIIFETERT